MPLIVLGQVINLRITSLCDKSVLPKHNGYLYLVVVRLSLLYEAKCWSINNSQVQKM